VGLCRPAWNYRLGWSRHYLGAEPLWLKVLSPALVLAGLLLMLRVFAVNSFASRTIQLEAGQKVISGGPYRIVRHPMYLGSVMMWTPLALGSYFALPACPAPACLRVPPAQRGKISSQRSAGLSRILQCHALPARPAGLVRLGSRKSRSCPHQQLKFS